MDKFKNWKKASASDIGNCVEVGWADDGTVGVRDSKQHGAGPVLEFTPTEWDAFQSGVRNREFG